MQLRKCHIDVIATVFLDSGCLCPTLGFNSMWLVDKELEEKIEK